MMADSGTSLNMIPDADFFMIRDHFFSDLNCTVLPNTLTACDCTEEQHQAIPDIKFKVNGTDFSMPRDLWYERGSNG